MKTTPGLSLAADLEALARRTPILATGERKLTIIFSGGKVRRSFVELGPLRPDELDEATR